MCRKDVIFVGADFCPLLGLQSRLGPGKCDNSSSCPLCGEGWDVPPTPTQNPSRSSLLAHFCLLRAYRLYTVQFGEA